MNSLWIKLAAAAVVAIAGIVGITHLTKNETIIIEEPGTPITLVGPQTHTFEDGSIVALATGASIRADALNDKRYFEHLTGKIDVTVAKGKGPFLVTSPYGDVKALGDAIHDGTGGKRKPTVTRKCRCWPWK